MIGVEEMRNTLEQISDAGHRFPVFEHSELSPNTTRRLQEVLDADCGFTDTNDGRGAPLVGVMIIACMSGFMGFMIGFAIGRI